MNILDVLTALFASMFIVWGIALGMYVLYALTYLPLYFLKKNYRKDA